MRVNHAGEIAAQALYHGQALMARSAATREFLLRLPAKRAIISAWCEQRLNELGSRPACSIHSGTGSFAIGARRRPLAIGTSLGFLTETERQVEGHLAEHLGACRPRIAQPRDP